MRNASADRCTTRSARPVDLPSGPTFGVRRFLDNRLRTSHSNHEQASQGFLDVRGCLTRSIRNPRSDFTAMLETPRKTIPFVALVVAISVANTNGMGTGNERCIAADQCGSALRASLKQKSPRWLDLCHALHMVCFCR